VRRVAHALLPCVAVQHVRILALAALVASVTACSSGHLGDGGPGVSPGTVTLRLLLTPGQSFCDVVDQCSYPTHVFIGKEPGNWLTTGRASVCGVDCSTCVAPPCAALATPVICAPAATGVAVTNVEATWDGSYVQQSTCGAAATTCTSTRFVSPGHYAARLCATPGTLADNTCTPTGPQECSEVTFDLPGPAVVDVPLPGSAID
jgi:hypothetical protein